MKYTPHVVFGLACICIFWVYLASTGRATVDEQFDQKLVQHFALQSADATKSKSFKILVTGGLGFIGSHVVQFFEEKVPQCSQIIILDTTTELRNLRYGTRHKRQLEDVLDVSSRVHLVQGSVGDKQLLDELFRRETRIRYVFHLGAMISVPESMKEPLKYATANTLGTISLFKSIEQFGVNVESILFASTAAVYGTSPLVPKREYFAPDCQSPYCQTKLDGEFYCKYVAQEVRKRRSDFGCYALRFFNVFGERQDPESLYAAAIPKFLQRAVKGEKLTIFGDGEQTRDFVYVKDVVLANVFVATHATKHTAFDVYNVGYGKTTTINELARSIIKATAPNGVQKPQERIEHVAPRPGDVKYSGASIDKLLALGWSPRYHFHEALQTTINWFQKNR